MEQRLTSCISVSATPAESARNGPRDPAGHGQWVMQISKIGTIYDTSDVFVEATELCNELYAFSKKGV